MKSSTWRWMAGFALATFGLTAQAADPIKIGSVLSTTGPAAFLGDPEAKTLEMYVESINKDGGVLGRQLQLVHYDDGSDANKANGFTKRLIFDDKVDVIIGGTTTGATMSMVPLVEKAEIPFISLAGAVVVIDPVKKWVFKMPHTDRMAAEKVFEDMKKRGISKIALVSETSGFGQSGKKESETVASKYGIDIVAQEVYGPKDTDMSPQLTKIKNNPAVQAVFIFGLGQGPALVQRNYKQLDIKLPVYESHGVCSEEFIKLARDAAEGTRLPCAALVVAQDLPDSDPQKPVVTGYAKAFQERWKQDVSTFGGHAYDGLMVYLDAVKRAGSTDKAKVRDAIESTKGLMGTGGEFNMSATDHMGLDLSAFRMLEIKGGHWTLTQ
ncbi:ABC transporter substrate-binding protein [Castellaniella defragrans]|uniref:Branched-chain amino acid ABC transporter, amino acid-binding protein n=2 Tax=Castellaniella defragrans TaxID=75697 RepID=W8WTG7_CASD6|nr:ABC transporter substrate-binding protein [Castellaniella defragrans]KAB0618286.1 ABC transporter substrate-binding protein [Castellaniella defragrans]MBB6082072.1 branched-chain amino acid transport system substrate-binding protein [Castellaniella defragrans]CDM22988.1 Branched-chain amino acid ABC transporter, amino acid-binding protein [Castellaniella defragrans 65Phen]